MIILVIHQDGVLFLEGECQPPVTADLDGPMARGLAVQRMQSPTGRSHVGRSLGIVQGEKLLPESLGMFWLDARLRSRLEKALDALMPEGLDHSYSV